MQLAADKFGFYKLHLREGVLLTPDGSTLQFDPELLTVEGLTTMSLSNGS
jgi:hypothetical protein